MKELQYLNKYFVKYKYRFLLGILITIIAQVFALFTPELVGNSIQLIESYLKNNTSNNEILKQSLFKNIGLIFLYTFIAGVLTFFMRQLLIVMSRYIEFDLKNEIYQHYQSLSLSFYKKNRTGDLMNRITEDVGKVRMYVGPAVMYTINTIIRFVAIILSMSAISPKLTFYSLLPLPILSYSIFVLSKKINKKSTAYQENLSKLSSFTQEYFSGIRVIKAYALEKNRIEAFNQIAIESKAKNIDLAKTNALFGPLMIFLIGLSYLIVIFVGGQMYVNKEITNLGIIAQFLLYIGMLVWPVASFGWVSSLVQEAAASQKRINEFLKETSEIENNGKSTEHILGHIEFKNVSFTYSDTKIEALKNINFTLKPGETLAILGKTGSGKSTLANLIARLYNCNPGSLIEIDNQNIENFDLFHLRKSISMVPQDTFLFSDTIANNIKFGNENATEEEIIKVAKLAAVHQNIIEFNDQYQTQLGERGITLSGGQKQRIAIARALIKQSAIVLLDDALSAVDTETEEEILNNLKNIYQNTSTIIITTRTSTAKNAQQIIILNNGLIEQQGTHNQLIKTPGYYQDLHLKQLEEKEID